MGILGDAFPGCTYNTVQDAINASGSGDVILAEPGIAYVESLVITSDLTLRAGSGNGLCDSPGSFKMNVAPPSGSRGITITGGTSRIAVDLIDVLVTGGDPVSEGGNIRVEEANVYMLDVALAYGEAQTGACLWIWNSDVTFEDGNISLCDGESAVQVGAGPSGTVELEMIDSDLWGGADITSHLVMLTGTQAPVGNATLILRGDTELRGSAVAGVFAYGSLARVEMHEQAQIRDNLGTGLTVIYGSAALYDESSIHHNDAIDYSVSPPWAQDGRGGGIQGSEATVELFDNVAIYSNSAEVLGGGLSMLESTLQISNAQGDTVDIYDNVAGVDGGGVFLADALFQTDTTGEVHIRDNVAGSDGGGVAAKVGSSVTMSTGLTLGRVWIHSNTADRDGGGMVFSESTGAMQGDIVVGAEVDQVDGTFDAGEANIAGARGGGIAIFDSPANLGEGTGFNTGGVSMQGPMWGLVAGIPTGCDTADLVPCQPRKVDNEGFPSILGNLANLDGATGPTGGGVFLSGSKFFGRGLVVSHNDASSNGSHYGKGGGFAAEADSLVTLEDTAVLRNTANASAGAHVDMSTLTLVAQPQLDTIGYATCADRRGATSTPWNTETDRYCSEISYNEALGADGGGLTAFDHATVVLSGVGILRNDTPDYGAAVKINKQSEVNMANCIVGHNVSQNDDPAVLVDKKSVLNSEFSTFSQGYLVWFDQESGGSLNGNIFWDDDLDASSTDMLLFTPLSFASGSCNVGLGVGQIAGSQNKDGVDPDFDPTSESDFELSSSSEAVDNCTAITGPAIDAFQQTRPPLSQDVGGHER